MNEDNLAEFLFNQIVDSGLSFAGGVPITPIRLLMRFVNWLDEDNPKHQRAASRALQRYIDYGNLPKAFFDYDKL